MAKATHPIVTSDAEIDAAIATAAAHPLLPVSSAAYDAAADVITMRFATGVHVVVPRQLLQGLQHATPSQLKRITVDGPGTGLVWPAIGVAHYVPALLAGLFGTRRWMAEIGRRGGARRTNAKALAARANGAKGGRPRKRPSGANATRKR